MMDARLRDQMEGLVKAELAMLTTGAALFVRWCELMLESEKAAADRLSALAMERKPVFPDSYERAAEELFTLWRDAARELAGWPRIAGMQYYAELAETRRGQPSEAESPGN